MTAHRLPYEFQHPNGKEAKLVGKKLVLEDGAEISLEKYVGCGAMGIIFGDSKVCVKLEDALFVSHYELDMIHWASEHEVGPKFYGWGYLTCSHQDFSLLMKMLPENRKAPRWIRDWNATPSEKVSICYTITERWQTDLFAFMHKRDNSDAIYWISPTVFERFKRKIDMIHKIGAVHCDIVSWNILIKIEENQIVDMVIADYGNATPRMWWFVRTDGLRLEIVKYFQNLAWAAFLEKAIEDFNPDYKEKIGEESALYYWLLNEPNNLDLAFISVWSMLRDGKRYLYDFYLPRPFDFTIKWTANGRTTLHIRTRKGKQEITLNGVRNLSHLRNVTKSYDWLQKFEFYDPDKKCLIPKDRESLFFPVQVIQRDITNGELFILMERDERDESPKPNRKQVKSTPQREVLKI